ncbi:hypothetical protein B296_00019427 [Ensete ventricosum]|uniref:Expansin-like EG45 domain-containing protein n=1 Tax=Ensete ventricosum TaxID=4639 RepID=A0A427B2P0_ENSVE|nr:hypothetical protein B296_00019427 [Ensete ventricosum]
MQPVAYVRPPLDTAFTCARPLLRHMAATYAAVACGGLCPCATAFGTQLTVVWSPLAHGRQHVAAAWATSAALGLGYRYFQVISSNSGDAVKIRAVGDAEFLNWCMRVWHVRSDAQRRGRLGSVEPVQEWRGLRCMLSGFLLLLLLLLAPLLRLSRHLLAVPRQVRCTNANYCSTDGVTIVITDSGASGNTDFILSQHAFSRMGQNADAGASLLSLGVVGIEYRSYPNKNITFKIDQSSNLYYFAFQIWYQQGNKDITAVQLCEVLQPDGFFRYVMIYPTDFGFTTAD